MENTPYAGIFAFFTFAMSVIAAVLAIDMYALLRTGEYGKTWRILITASVMLALAQALRLASWLDWNTVRHFYLADIAQMAFVLMLGYAFYSQRQLFSRREKNRSQSLSVEDRLPARRASDFLGAEDEPKPASTPDETNDADDIEWESSRTESSSSQDEDSRR